MGMTKIADDQRLEERAEQVQVSKYPRQISTHRGDGERGIYEVALFGTAEHVARSQVRRPGRLILDDHQAPQRDEVVADGVAVSDARIGATGDRTPGQQLAERQAAVAYSQLEETHWDA